MTMSAMCRILPVWIVAVMALLTPPAYAESVTVAGQGIVKKMVANNAQTRVVAKVYAPGGKCAIQGISLYVTARSGQHYHVNGTCAAGTWRKALYQLDSGMPVKCADLRLTYDSTDRFWKFVVPRSCLDGLPNKVRFRTEVAGAGGQLGSAGPTKLLARG